MDKLNHIAEAIGRYHDKTVMLAHLNSFLATIISGDEKKAIEKICNAETANLKKEKIKVLKLVKGLTGSERKT